MPGEIPKRVLIYHFTHIDNLDSILTAGVLECKRQAAPERDVGEPEIQAGRSLRRVPDPPGGTIHDFVPFYFTKRSPMLYRLIRHYKTSYRGKQEEFVYIVSALDLIQNAGIPFVFSDGHSTVRVTDFFTSANDLDKVDWDVIADNNWQDTAEDNDRKRRKQAEFMVKGQFPLTLSLGFAVMNDSMVERVKAIVARYPDFAGAHVLSRPQWYYSGYA